MADKKLQVFVSSTYADLLEERQAAVAAILKSGHIPAGMELFTAGDTSQWETIKRWITESDVYMLILGGRYGSVEPTSGLSYTELEYDFAVSAGKPLFSVVIKEDALENKIKQLGSTCLEKENPKELSAFRGKVLSRISSFFSDSKDIKLCVHESMAEFTRNPDLIGWVSGELAANKDELQREAALLQSENSKLREELEKLQRQPISAKEVDISLINVLRNINITIPPEATSNKLSINTTLMDVFYNNRTMLIAGVTNSIQSSEGEIFMFYHIVPKLQTHGLADSEKVPGSKYRRGFLTKAGMALAAAVEKSFIEKTIERSEGQNKTRSSAPGRQAEKVRNAAEKPGQLQSK